MNGNRAYISDEDKKIAGVCAGIADNFNVDPTLIRILFVLATLATGLWLGCLAYYLLTLFMPVRYDKERLFYSNRKKVKNLFLYSLVVISVYLPVLFFAIYVIALVCGFTLFCLI